MPIITYDLYAVTVGVATYIGQITRQGFSAGIQQAMIAGAGLVERQGTSNIGQNPTISFSSQAVATALGVIGLSGLSLGSSL